MKKVPFLLNLGTEPSLIKLYRIVTPPPPPRQGEQHARLDLVSHVNCCDQIKCLHSLIAFSHLA